MVIVEIIGAGGGGGAGASLATAVVAKGGGGGGGGVSFFDYTSDIMKDKTWLRKNTVERIEPCIIS